MKNIIIIVGICFGVALCSCEDSLINEPPLKNSPVGNFDLLWQDFHDYYGLFEVKKINWDSVYAVYKPQVHEGMSEAEFYAVSTSMLSILNDAHVTLFPTNPDLPRWSVDLEDGISHQEDYKFEVVKENYLQNHKQAGGVFDWGWLSDSIGYIHVDHFMVKLADVDDAMKEIAPALKKAKGIVLDIRDAPGGQDPVGQRLAGYFAQEKYLYMKTRKRSGPNPADFTDWLNWYVDPMGGGELKDKPVILMTTRFTGSGAETFSLAMLELPQVTQAGDTTAGAFSDNPMRQLYNGWMFSLSVGDFRDASGESFEGRGLAPALLWENNPADVKAGKDEALEKAIQHLAE
ncbi:S41 family peptidase [Cesiribacter sp. SM1]|uniref:S41 family peptidase n=1 Tax=Cesiribacter sp. SM1 TaxID=2861196 RepID=UPI001CD4B73A|nr:S41 family peptidase [Cesiribacter sp. SM1]